MILTGHSHVKRRLDMRKKLKADGESAPLKKNVARAAEMLIDAQLLTF